MSDHKTYQDDLGISHEGPILCEKEGFDMIDCATCSHIHAIPIPDVATLDQFYKQKFYEQERKKDYAALQKRDIDWWNDVFTDRLNQFEAHLGRKGRLLDIGCGPGFFLGKAKELGWDALGIEPSESASNYAKEQVGVEVLNSSYELETIETIGQFDVIYSHGVLEHVRHPHHYFEKALELLKGGGLLFTSVANDFNPFQEVLRTSQGVEPWWLVPPEHLNYFNVESIKRVYQANQFDVLTCATSFPIDMFLLMGDNYIGNNELGSASHARRKNFEAALEKAGKKDLKDSLYQAFADLGLGRQVDIIGRKA